jgi:hypothetical protein
MMDTIAFSGPRIESTLGLRAELSRALEAFGLYIAVEVDGNKIVLSGELSSPEEREAARDIAVAFAKPLGLAVDDGLDLMPTFPDSAFVVGGGAAHGDFGYLHTGHA